MAQLNGKVALVTVSGRCICRVIALRLASEWADVTVVDLNDENTKAVAEEIRALGRKATTFQADVSKRDDVFSAVDHTEQELGNLHIMVNNAGIASIDRKSTRLNSSHVAISYAVFCLKKKTPDKLQPMS